MSGLHRLKKFFATASILLAPTLAIAAETARFAVPTDPVVPESASGMLRMLVSLGLVLALVFAAAWLMRKLRAGAGGSAPGIQVLAQISLGARERAVMIRVGNRDILLGVAPGNVRTLHVVEAGETVIDAAGTGVQRDAGQPVIPPAFRELLRRSLGR